MSESRAQTQKQVKISVKLPNDLRTKASILGFELTGRRRCFGELLKLAIDHALLCPEFPKYSTKYTGKLMTDTTILKNEYIEKFERVRAILRSKNIRDSVNRTVKILIAHFLECPLKEKK